jgi:hypothetical protein
MVDQWARISWSLQESFSDYLQRSLAERWLLQNALSEIIESTYGDLPNREMRKAGM